MWSTIEDFFYKICIFFLFLSLFVRQTNQVEMTGSSIFDYVHQGDHTEIAEQLGLSLTSQSQSSTSGMTSPSSTDEPTGTHNPHGNFVIKRLSQFFWLIEF